MTTVDYKLAVSGEINLSVFNTTGQHLQTLGDGWQMAGQYSTVFNGLTLPTGVYILRLEVEDQSQMMQLVLLK